MSFEINFYNNRTLCISQYEQTPSIEKAVSLIKSYGNWIKYAMFCFYLMLYRVKMKKSYTEPDSSTLAKAHKLVVCIHGLYSYPSQFSPLVKELEIDGLTGTALYIPEVINWGHAPLDKAVKPIFETIKAWGGKELVMVCISNGARIGRAIEVEIAKSGLTHIQKIRFISIAGACKGSSSANMLPFPSIIAKELPLRSERSNRLNVEWEQHVNSDTRIDREYTFFASPHDWSVPDFESTLMEVNSMRKSRYAIVSCHGHNSLSYAVSKTVAKIIS